MMNLTGHETGNGGYGHGNTYGNSPFLASTLVIRKYVKDSSSMFCSYLKSMLRGYEFYSIRLRLRRSSMPEVVVEIKVIFGIKEEKTAISLRA
jgi:hypothetical protein